jgi:hypothetical protein
MTRLDDEAPDPIQQPASKPALRKVFGRVWSSNRWECRMLHWSSRKRHPWETRVRVSVRGLFLAWREANASSNGWHTSRGHNAEVCSIKYCGGYLNRNSRTRTRNFAQRHLHSSSIIVLDVAGMKVKVSTRCFFSQCIFHFKSLSVTAIQRYYDTIKRFKLR